MKWIVMGVLVLVLSGIMSSFALAQTMTIRPDSQGYYSAWVNSGCGSGTSEWQCVDESDPANVSDVLYTSSKNIYESFNFGNTGLSGATINSVTLYYYAKYSSSTRYQFQPLIRASSTNYLGSVKSTTSSYATYSQTYTTNPATGSAWTIAQVDALEAGMKSYSINYGGYVAQVYAVVDYSYPDSCSDTDGGNILATFGTTSGYFSNSSYSHDDYCVDSGNIMEYYCSGTRENSSQQSCGTDSYGSNFCSGGDVYRNYTDYSCASGACSSSITPELYQDCVTGQYCSVGQCLWSDSCSDTDGGNYKNIFGTASGYFANLFYSYDDYCVDSSYIMEYFCTGSYKNSSQQSCGTDAYTGSYYCFNGESYRNYTDYSCASGACSSSLSQVLMNNCTDQQYCSYGYCYWSDSCSETDGGVDLPNYGTTSGYSHGYAYSSNDTCTDSSTLREYSCSGTALYNNTYSCTVNGTGSCSAGACI